MFDAHGVGTSTATPTEPFGYGAQAGYYTDLETGLQCLSWRYYDPAAGRFLTRDPISYAGGVNLYSYVGNGPVDGWDPRGLFGWKQIGSGFLAAGQAILSIPHRFGDWVMSGFESLGRMKLKKGTPTLQDANPEAYPALPRAGREIGSFIHDEGSDIIGAIAVGGTAAVAEGASCDAVAGGTAGNPNRAYSARVLLRAAQEPGPYHNFPETFDAWIFGGNRTVVSPTYTLYTRPGTINGVDGIFEIGVRPSGSGQTEIITHRFFRPVRQ